MKQKVSSAEAKKMKIGSNPNRKISPVEIQEGMIDPNPNSIKQMTYSERVTDRRAEMRDLRDGKTLILKTPRK